MFYAIMARDVPNSVELRSAVRPDHLQYIKALVDDGRVLVAGPHPALDSPDPGPAGMSGSLVIAEFDSLADAETWASQDPYVRQGVFDSVEIKPFLRVYP